MLKVLNIALKKPLYSNWLILFPGAVIVALLAVFSPLLVYLIPGIWLFYYFWNNRAQLVIFLLIYTPFEELVVKMVPDGSYAFIRYMWEGALFIFISLIIIEKVLLKKSWKWSIVDKFVLLFIFSWLLSTVWNNTSWLLSAYQIKNLIRYISIFYIIYNLEISPKFINKIINIIITMGVIQALICIGQAIEGDILVKLFRPKEVIIGGELIKGKDIAEGLYYTKFTGSFQRSNELAYYLVTSMSFVAAKYFTQNKTKYLLMVFAVMAVALFLTSSRINWISIYLIIGFLLFKIKNKWRYVYTITPLVILIIAICTFSIMNVDDINSDFNIFNRFIYIFTSDYIDIISNFGRLYVITNVTPAVFMQNSILGIGPGSFMQISKQMSEEEIYGRADALGLDRGPIQYVHDVGYVALFVQVGFLGLLAMIGIFVKVFRESSNMFSICSSPTGRTLYLGTICLIVATAIQHLASFNLLYRNQSLVIWVIMGTAVLYSSSRKELENSNCQ